MKLTLATILLASILGVSSAETPISETPNISVKGVPKPYVCSQGMPHIDSNQGFLSISRNTTYCGFEAMDEAKFFAIRTDNLKLKAGDTMEIKPKGDDKQNLIFQPPFNQGYLIFGIVEPQIKFNFAKLDETVMEVEFLQNVPTIPIDGDIYNEFRIVPNQIESANLALSKTVNSLVHLEFSGAHGTLQQMLIDTDQKIVPLNFNANQAVVVKTSPAFTNCSATLTDDKEASHEIIGPDPNQFKQPYRCVNIFTNEMAGQAHYEVDFTNFLDISDQDDELTIDDGESRMKIVKLGASEYIKHVIAFNGKKLTVVYDSPRFISPQVPFKLTVKSKANGGNVDKPGLISLPTTGAARYILRPMPNEYAALSLNLGDKLAGADLTFSDDQGELLTLKDGDFIPPFIGSNQPGAQMSFEISIKSKLTGQIEYKVSDRSCNGIVSNQSGVISISGNNQACYWLFGAKQSVISVNYNSLLSNGCMEIHSLSQSKPTFKLCNLTDGTILPDFVVGPSYLKVSLQSDTSVFQASVSQPSKLIVHSMSLFQHNITSLGYPSSYAWHSGSETITQIDSRNRTSVFTIFDLDLRQGEKLTLNKTDYDASNYLAVGDMDISNKTLSIQLKHPGSSNDFSIRRGYKLVNTQFQKIIRADMSKNVILTPKNLTSVLLKISAPQGMRVAYNITFKDANEDSQINVVDARSILGRAVYVEERLNGSTTSDNLLISYIAKANVTVPELTVNYNQIACNKTIDHSCDNSTRCVPADKLCKGKAYCSDGSDLKVRCSNGPTPIPSIVEKGVGGLTLFFLSILMFSLGIVVAIYGPDSYKYIETRFRSGQYTTFTSSE